VACVQEDYIKDEMKNLKREMIRAKEVGEDCHRGVGEGEGGGLLGIPSRPPPVAVPCFPPAGAWALRGWLLAVGPQRTPSPQRPPALTPCAPPPAPPVPPVLRNESLQEIKRIQAVPLVIGQFMEMIDTNYGIVSSTTGSTCVARCLRVVPSCTPSCLGFFSHLTVAGRQPCSGACAVCWACAWAHVRLPTHALAPLRPAWPRPHSHLPACCACSPVWPRPPPPPPLARAGTTCAS
jgi:hypothetical protein